MSILSALKAKGAKGKNIEEAVKTLPLNGGADSPIFVANVTATKNGADYSCESDATFSTLISAYKSGKVLMVRLTINPGGGAPEDYWYRRTMTMKEAALTAAIGFQAVTFNVDKTVNTLYLLSFGTGGSITLSVY